MPLALAGAFGPCRPEAPRPLQGTGRFAVTFPPSLQAFILWIKCFWKGGSRGRGITARARFWLRSPTIQREPCLPRQLLLLLGLVFLTDPPSQESAPQKTEQPPRTGRARGGIAAGCSASGFARDRRRFRVTPCPRPRRDFLLLSSSFVSAHLCAFPLQKLFGGGGGSKAGCLWALFNRHFLIWGKKGDWMLPPGIFCPPTCSSNDFWPCGEQRMRERRPEPCVVQEGKVLSPLAAPWGRHHPLLHQAQRTASAPRASRPVPQPLSSA